MNEFVDLTSQSPSYVTASDGTIQLFELPDTIQKVRKINDANMLPPKKISRGELKKMLQKN